MRGERTTTALPEDLQRYFWDYDLDRLSWDGSRNTIVKRLLQSGGLDAVTWLRAQMSDAEIRDYIVGRRGRGIEPRRLRFWSVVLGMPRQQVDEWIAAGQANPWSRRTR